MVLTSFHLAFSLFNFFLAIATLYNSSFSIAQAPACFTTKLLFRFSLKFISAILTYFFILTTSCSNYYFLIKNSRNHLGWWLLGATLSTIPIISFIPLIVNFKHSFHRFCRMLYATNFLVTDQ